MGLFVVKKQLAVPPMHRLHSPSETKILAALALAITLLMLTQSFPAAMSESSTTPSRSRDDAPALYCCIPTRPPHQPTDQKICALSSAPLAGDRSRCSSSSSTQTARQPQPRRRLSIRKKIQTELLVLSSFRDLIERPARTLSLTILSVLLGNLWEQLCARGLPTASDPPPATRSASSYLMARPRPTIRSQSVSRPSYRLY